MAEDGNRVKISPQLDETLNEILDKRKNLGKKDLTKVKLLDEVCNAGLNYLNEKPENKPMGSVPPPAIPDQPVRHRETGYVLETKSKLKQMQEAIYEKEDRLEKREQQLLDREKNLNDRFIQFFEEKDAPTKSAEITKYWTEYLRKQFEINAERFQKLYGDIADLKKIISQKDREILNLLNQIKENTKSNLIRDYILPILAPGMVSLKWMIEENDKNNPRQSEINLLLAMFSILSRPQQAIFLGKAKEIHDSEVKKQKSAKTTQNKPQKETEKTGKK
jgi:hypothetical protein